MMDPAIKADNADIRKFKRSLHKLYESAVNEIIFAFSPFLDNLLRLEKNAPEEGRSEWLKRERMRVIYAMNPEAAMMEIIRKTNKKAFRMMLPLIREILLRNFIYIINKITEEIELTADLLLDLWTEGLLNDYDELVEESERDDPQSPEAKAIAAWRESIEQERLGTQAAKNFIRAIPGMKGNAVERIKKGVVDIVNRTENHTGRMVDNFEGNFEGKGRQAAGEKIEVEFGEDLKKVWICTFHNSRDSHIKMHKQARDLDEDFISGLGNVLRFPGDMTAPVEDWINCQCYVIIVPAYYVRDGKLIKTEI